MAKICDGQSLRGFAQTISAIFKLAGMIIDKDFCNEVFYSPIRFIPKYLPRSYMSSNPKTLFLSGPNH